MRSNNKIFLLLVTVLSIGFLRPAPLSAKETIMVAGSTTVLPVVTRGAERFMAAHPGVRITVNPGGSGVGVKSVGNGLVDIGMASRRITDEEIKNFSPIDFKVFVIGRDAVACVVSSEIYDAGVRSLTRLQIKKIYSGEIDNWKEVGGPDKRIFVIDKEMHRGTRHVFMKYVFGDSRARARGADLIAGSNNEEQTKVALSDTAIGMLSLAWINKDVKGVGLRVKGKIIEPTLKNIRNGTYPISRDLNLITRGEDAPTVKAFIDYILSPEGQKIVEESGFVPVR
ncbi:MAG: phosphate ABC transporter substrate-binding protein [Thermodesulfobacteriota bacterium]|nr:MAG: phosphate ABC transporter substrate-binding protein [Thermodesulfobacteriota bacterium]